MAQRAMIQILYLDKGRLTSYRIGEYDKNCDGGFYQRATGKKPWSSIGDEVWNIDMFVIDDKSEAECSYTLEQEQLEAIWDQYDKIMDAGVLSSAINQSTPTGAYATYRGTAVTESGLSITGYSETDLLDGICKEEGTSGNVAKHCDAPSGSLSWNSVIIGEVNKDSCGGEHTYSDGGLGWGKVQPYNESEGGLPASNLYDPQENMTRVAKILKKRYSDASEVSGDKARIWHAVYGYHHFIMQTGVNPVTLRTTNPEPAGYADRVFGHIGSPFTPIPVLNTDD